MNVFVRYGACEILSMEFIRWQRKLYPKDWTGKRKPGWWGIGAVVHSSWIWDHPDGRLSSRYYKLPPNHNWLAPHTELYLNYNGAVLSKGPTLKRPTMKDYLCLVKYNYCHA